MTPTHTSRVDVPSKIPQTSYDDRFCITRKTSLLTITYWKLGILHLSRWIKKEASFTVCTKLHTLSHLVTLDSIPILMKLPIMVNVSLTMSRMYQPLMNSILSPQLTLRPSLWLKNCTYSWVRRWEMINGALNVIHTTGKLGDRERHLTTSLCLRDLSLWNYMCWIYGIRGQQCLYCRM